MRIPIADSGTRLLLVRMSYLVLISLASCAKADPPEEFVADPSLQDDYVDSLPATGSSQGFQYQIIQGHAILEGDILLGTVDGEGNLKAALQARGVGKNDAFNRWPDGIVVYEAPANNSLIQQANVEKAIEHWMQFTTLSFVERTQENADQYPHYIQFRDTQSCASHVGMIGGPQPVYISDACSVGSIIHELGHAVGLFHEHTRADRDNFVQIDWSQIVEGKDINFNLQTANADTYSDYDYGSIMHYGANFFSNSGRPTIIVNDGITIGQRDGLSLLDIQSVNTMYQTDLALGTPSSSASTQGMEIDITTYNQGSLGAHDVQLVMRMDNNASWLGVSRDSGWDCLTFGDELKCTRDTMREQTESRFTVLADTNEISTESLSVYLTSRTQDQDPGNNALNNDGVTWESLDLDLMAAEDGDSGTVDTTGIASSPPPLLGAAQNNQVTTGGAQQDQASAGTTGASLLLALMGAAGFRRFVKNTA